MASVRPASRPPQETHSGFQRRQPEVRGITGFGLKEAKDLIEGTPKNVIEGVARNEAEKIKATLEEVGATVQIKCP